jgi:hypothetical protein
MWSREPGRDGARLGGIGHCRGKPGFRFHHQILVRKGKWVLFQHMKMNFNVVIDGIYK